MNEKLAKQSQSSKTTLTEQAYHQIEELIVTLEINPGDVVTESELALRLQIGRTPIREALNRLSLEGLIRVLSRYGYLVTDVHPNDQLKLLEVRRPLEVILTTSSAKKSTLNQREQFKAISEGMSEASNNSDELEFMRLDLKFNELLKVSAHNEFASRAMGLLSGLSRRFWFMHFKQVGDLPLCAKLHADQAKAVAEGDVRRSERSTNALIDYIEDFTRESAEIELKK